MKIFLLGMMGSGKTYWMERLAKKLDLPRFDLDKLVEDVEDKTIQQIFRDSGEAHFRKMESIVLKWFADRDEFILATGGGTPCFVDNMDWMNNEGLTIWLDEDTKKLFARLAAEKAHRPLIADLNDNQLLDYLEAKHAERKPYYSKAKIIVAGKDINEKNLLALINQYTNA